MNKLLGILAIVAVVAFASAAFATSYDYADATGYDNAGVYAKNPTWNRLGTSWTGEVNASAVANDNDLDDGVSWSINGGGYGYGDITVGDSVTFEFILSKVEWGRHHADYLKSWIDWNNDQDFIDDGEMVYAVAYDFTPNTKPDGSLTQFLNADRSPKNVGTYYYTTTFNNVGDYWLRARVACNADAVSLDRFRPTGNYTQGEIEDWKLTVKHRVPEPTTIAASWTWADWVGRSPEKV